MTPPSPYSLGCCSTYKRVRGASLWRGEVKHLMKFKKRKEEENAYGKVKHLMKFKKRKEEEGAFGKVKHLMKLKKKRRRECLWKGQTSHDSGGSSHCDGYNWPKALSSLILEDLIYQTFYTQVGRAVTTTDMVANIHPVFNRLYEGETSL